MPTKARRKNLESQSQKAVIQWWRIAHRSLGVNWEHLLYAVPNGGARTPRAGAILKAEGVRAGAPDLNLDVARGPYHGLRIELKTSTGSVSDEQLQFHAHLIGQGYDVAVCRGWDQARAKIESYLKQ